MSIHAGWRGFVLMFYEIWRVWGFLAKTADQGGSSANAEKSQKREAYPKNRSTSRTTLYFLNNLLIKTTT